MNPALNYHAIAAWAAFGAQDYSELEQHSKEIYNSFVHNPSEILNLDDPLLIGKIFQVCLGFQEPDVDIQEVRAENAFLCFSQSLNSEKESVHDEASARLMMLLIQAQRYLKRQTECACENTSRNPYSFLGMRAGSPMDMPIATNTKMLYAAYYLYNGIINKDSVSKEFINPNEKNMFEAVKHHVLDNCNQLTRTPANRKMELGKIVFDKICSKLKQDVEEYSNSI